MKKLLVAGCLAVFTLFLPSRCPAVPLDMPYVTLISTNNTGSIIVSTTTFPNANSTVNGNIANYQWCISHVVVTGNNAQQTFTMAYSTAPFTQALQAGTTDFKVVITTMVPVYDEVWPYRQPYCAPVGQAVLTLTSTVAAAVIEVEGYLWKGWNP